MKIVFLFFCLILFVFLESCSSTKKITNEENLPLKSTVVLKTRVPAKTINTKNIPAEEVVKFAETLIGVPYKYGSSKKENGFDCSGFITYVFSHFKISVPRSSKDFTNAGKNIDIQDSKRGDLILFTGSDPKSGVVGHMGIITYNKKGKLEFIHSATANNRGVMISGMSSYFITRYVKVIRVFNVI